MDKNTNLIALEKYKSDVSQLKIDTTTKKKLVTLLEKKQLQTKECAQNNSDQTNVLSITNLETCNRRAELEFRKGISTTINKNQFEQLFKNELDQLLANRLSATFQTLISPFRLTNSQLKKLRTVVKKELKLQIETSEYLAFNPNLANATTDAIKAKSDLLYFDTFNTFNLDQPIFINTDPRLENLVSRAKKAKLSNEKINQIIRYHIEAVIATKEISQEIPIKI